MKSKKKLLYLTATIITIAITSFFINIYIKKSNTINIKLDNNNTIVEIVDDNNLKIKTNEQITLNVKIADIFKTSNKIFKWKSTDEEVAEVDANGVVTTKKAGTTYIKCQLNDKTIKTKLTVYEKKKIVIVVGDSRMDDFKDDNNFESTDKYEIKYTDQKNILSTYERFYVVSLSGMYYDWLVGNGYFKDENATKYVKKIIKEYEDKTDEYTKYEIKILFNLGVNDLKESHFQSTTPSDVAKKYLTTLEEILNNEWSSETIERISLNMITLLPIQDEQIKCHFPGRYNKFVTEFNEYIKNNYQGEICDIYNDLEFTDDVFRDRPGKESCSIKDGLHFSKKFNTEKLYPYLTNYCANK